MAAVITSLLLFRDCTSICALLTIKINSGQKIATIENRIEVINYFSPICAVQNKFWFFVD
ncbi:hypothetical protein LPAF129_18150 [Ligilactobacillus pabuli]|uniref:Secreted protein n=1 Tax=Ligilactobacillus pabuli TaxID=2886039 RepID=A0ABQ5JJA4_9LACO|nr:hypothetical protein LPAF129_18150 [Ligilactobacillus pabuli]